MAKLRKIQFYRNGQPETIAVPETGADLKSAYKQVEQDFITNGKVNDMLDGEILLYRFSYDGQVHTLVGVVHAPETGSKTLEVLANYDMLGGEISAAITAALAELDGSATIASIDDNGVVTLKAGIVQTDGKVSQEEVDDIKLAIVATTGAAADVTVATGIEGLAATTVQGALAELQGDIDAINDQTITAVANQAVAVTTDEETGNTTIGLVLANGEKVLSQTADGLKTTLNLTYDSTAKAIKLWGKSTETPIATVDATDFIKDGMLADATIVSGSWAEGSFTESETGKDKAIKFVWKTYQQGQSGQGELLKTEYLNVESLVDAYIAGNEWIEIDGTNNKISHKTVDGLDSTNAHGITSDVTVDNTDEKTFKVPTLTVDAAGHVVSVDEKTVTITLPESIDTAVQTVTSEEVLNTTDKFVAVHATREDDSNDVVLTSELQTQEIATATTENNGLATALDVKNYVDTNSTTVSGYTKTTGEGESTVSTVVTEVVSTENTNGSTNYQVKLPEITVQTPEPTENSMDINTNTHTYMTGIETDGFGRVTKVITETMREDFDAGTY